MNQELPQPFNQDDIRKDPKAVVIALLIGLLLIFGSVIGVLFFKLEKKEDKIANLYDKVIDYRTKKGEYYEKMIFYRTENEMLKDRDSLTKKKTQPYVEKILQP